MPENIGNVFNYSRAICIRCYTSAHLPGTLNGSEVPGDFHDGFSVVISGGTGRGIAMLHLLVFGVSDLGQP